MNRARLPFCWLRFLRSSLRRGNNRVSHPGVQLACARRERETATRRANDVQDCQDPMGAASVPGTPVNGRYMRYGVFVLTIDGRRTGAPHGTLLASPRAAAPRWYMLYLRRYCRLPRRRGLPRYIARVYGAHHPQMGVVTCVEIKILRRVRAESSRRPPRHRRKVCTRRTG